MPLNWFSQVSNFTNLKLSTRRGSKLGLVTASLGSLALACSLAAQEVETSPQASDDAELVEEDDTPTQARLLPGESNANQVVDSEPSSGGELTPAAETKLGGIGCGPRKRMPGHCLDRGNIPDYNLDWNGSGGGSGSGVMRTQPSTGGLSNPFASSLEPGFDSAGTDIIGDFLKSGGLVRLNFRPGALAPAGANQTGALVRDGDRFTFTDNNNNAFVTTSGNRVVFRAPSPLGIDDPSIRFDANGISTFKGLERVTLDDLGNEISPPERGVSVQQNAAGSASFTGRIDSAVAALVNPAVANVGVIKAAEGSNPVPRDRAFFFYSFFDGVQLGDPKGIGINRCTPGFEKTFFNGTASFEARFPFATTLDSNFNFTKGATNSTSNAEFGDILLTVKSILAQDEKWIISGGVQVSLPTADDLKFVFTDSTLGATQTAEFLRIKNEAVHVMPLIAGMWLPADRWFVQGFAQLDFDTNGKSVLLNQNPFVPNSSLESVGRFNDATFLYADVSVGYWLLRDPPESVRTITGFAPQLELHYNRSLTQSDRVSFGDRAQVGTGAQNIEVINLTVGGAFELWHQTMVSVGYATPVSGGNDREFNGELRVLMSHRFGGGQGRLARTPSNR